MGLEFGGQFLRLLLLVKLKLSFVSSVIKRVHATSGGLRAEKAPGWMEV